MATYTDPTVLTGLFYETYGDTMEKLLPDVSKIAKAIPFVAEEKQEGNKYHQPVIVKYEKGITLAAPDAGAFALNASIAMKTEDAQIQGSQILLRSVLSYDAAARASSSKRAFQKATELLFESMKESAAKVLELELLYGQTELGLCATSANADATHTVITMVTAAFAAGIWIGMEDLKLDAYYTNGTTLINSNAALVITAVDIALRTITVSGHATDIAALDSYISGAGANVTKLRLYGAGGTTTAEMAGLDKIITNTGTLFNISATTYAVWKGNSYAVGSSALSFGKVIAGLIGANNKGLMDQEVDLFVNPRAWIDLSDDLAALRVADSSYSPKKIEQGTEELSYRYMGGKINVIPSMCIKEGEAFCIPTKKFIRVGAQDLSFKTPGRGEEIFMHAADRAGYEYRNYTDQAIFTPKISWCTKYTGIVNSVAA